MSKRIRVSIISSLTSLFTIAGVVSSPTATWARPAPFHPPHPHHHHPHQQPHRHPSAPQGTDAPERPSDEAPTRTAPPPPARTVQCKTEVNKKALIRAIGAVAPTFHTKALVHKVNAGNTYNCLVYWVQVRANDGSEDTPLNIDTHPSQILFFKKDVFVRTATPEPRRFMNVIGMNGSTVEVLFRTHKLGDKPLEPSIKRTVRYTIGRKKPIIALDPIPAPD